MRKEQILRILPNDIRGEIEKTNIEYMHLQEIRIRIHSGILMVYKGEEWVPPRLKNYKVKERDMKEILEYISEYSLYAYEQEVKQGFITIEGGHRVGVVGKAVIEDGRIKNLKYISSFNIRLAHEMIGCADKLLPYIIHQGNICHTLLISPPRCGKTTILRDLIRTVSDGGQWMKGKTVGVVDERSELGACYHGIPQNQMGRRTDILDACPKVEGMMMLVRSMSPEVIVIDELGGEEDVHAVEYAIHCGCKMIGSIHGVSLADIKKKPIFHYLNKNRVFERYVELCNEPVVGSVRGIYDGDGNLLCQGVR